MVSISLCMIVRNEEKVLGRCLDCIKDIADEIIIVDTGSVDRTKETAEKYTKKIYNFKWNDDFSAARNFSFKKATKDYIMWLDADDVILNKDKLMLKELKETLNADVDVVMMKYNVMLGPQKKSVNSFYRERLLKRSKNFIWHEKVHEYISFSGKILNTDICVTHKREHADMQRNLNIFEKILSEEKTLSSRNCFYYAKELFKNGRIDDAITYYEKFLGTKGEFLSNYIISCIDLSKCYYIKNKKEYALKTLLKSFEFDIPKAEVCCQLGYLYKASNEYKKAIFWFELASKLKKPENYWGLIDHDCWDYIPYIELSLCYYNVGCVKEAVYYNNIVLNKRPNDSLALKNKKLFG